MRILMNLTYIYAIKLISYETRSAELIDCKFIISISVKCIELYRVIAL